MSNFVNGRIWEWKIPLQLNRTISLPNVNYLLTMSSLCCTSIFNPPLHITLLWIGDILIISENFFLMSPVVERTRWVNTGSYFIISRCTANISHIRPTTSVTFSDRCSTEIKRQKLRNQTFFRFFLLSVKTTIANLCIFPW